MHQTKSNIIQFPRIYNPAILTQSDYDLQETYVSEITKDGAFEYSPSYYMTLIDSETLYR